MSEENRKVIKVGSRKSELALIQTKYVIACLQKLFPDTKFEIHTMTTMGDRVLNTSLPKIGEKALFTKDLEDALRNGGVDFVVHSLKDLPTQLPNMMTIGAVLEREDPRDALVLNRKFLGANLKTLPEGSVIGTSSLRRSAQLSRFYPHLKVHDIRGNLNTRLAKLDAPQSKFCAIVLAHAGLVRMGWTKRVDQVLNPEELLYAVGQGALAVECRVNDPFVLSMLARLCDVKTQCRILCERSFLKTLGGGCSAPVAVCSVLKESVEDEVDFSLIIDGAVWSLNGQTEIVDKGSCSFKLEKIKDYSDEEVTPKKKLKPENPRKSPEIIDDNVSPSSSSSNAKQEIINIHGKLFHKCPFSGKSIDNNETIDNTGKSDKKPVQEVIEIHEKLFQNCPISGKNIKKNDSGAAGKCPMTGIYLNTGNISGSMEKKSVNPLKCPITGSTVDNNSLPLSLPIGQDFMGDCPYFSTEEKVKFEDVGAGDTLKCPVLSNTEQIQHCPYFSKHGEVQLIDYEENCKNGTNTTSSMHVIEDHHESDIYLYCGMFCHDLPRYKSVFDKCEALGRDLANKLIANGALEVMRCAQSEIHAKV